MTSLVGFPGPNASSLERGVPDAVHEVVAVERPAVSVAEHELGLEAAGGLLLLEGLRRSSPELHRPCGSRRLGQVIAVRLCERGLITAVTGLLVQSMSVHLSPMSSEVRRPLKMATV